MEHDPVDGQPAAPDQPSLRIEFDWDGREYAQVTTRLTRELFRSRRWMAVLVALGGWVVWQMASIVAVALREPSWTLLVAAAPWILLIALWAWMIAGGAGWVDARRTAKADSTRTGPQVHLFDAKGLTVDTGAGAIVLPWSGMARVLETPDFFLWYWHRRMAFFTPKRALEPDEMQALRNWVRTYAPDATVAPPQ